MTHPLISVKIRKDPAFIEGKPGQIFVYKAELYVAGVPFGVTTGSSGTTAYYYSYSDSTQALEHSLTNDLTNILHKEIRKQVAKALKGKSHPAAYPSSPVDKYVNSMLEEINQPLDSKLLGGSDDFPFTMSEIHKYQQQITKAYEKIYPAKDNNDLAYSVKDSLKALIPGLEDMKVSCPKMATDECHWKSTATLLSVIVHLNDRHTWTRERIADWLETLDFDLSMTPISTDEGESCEA